MSDLTIADLNGNHIGQTITIRDGGAIYTGSLRFVHHDRAAYEGFPQKAFIWLDAGEWSHRGHYPIDTPVEAARIARAEAGR